MERLRKQQSKSFDNKCLVCGTVVLGSMGKLKSHIIRRHSTMKNPRRCYHCGQKGHGQINIGHKQAKSECTSITIDEEGLHKVRKYLEFTKARWIALTKDLMIKGGKEKSKTGSILVISPLDVMSVTLMLFSQDKVFSAMLKGFMDLKCNIFAQKTIAEH